MQLQTVPSMEERTYKKGKVLVHEGSVPEGLFLILSGTVEILHGPGVTDGSPKRGEVDADFAGALSESCSSGEEGEEEGTSARNAAGSDGCNTPWQLSIPKRTAAEESGVGRAPPSQPATSAGAAASPSVAAGGSGNWGWMFSKRGSLAGTLTEDTPTKQEPAPVLQKSMSAENLRPKGFSRMAFSLGRFKTTSRGPRASGSMSGQAPSGDAASPTRRRRGASMDWGAGLNLLKRGEGSSNSSPSSSWLEHHLARPPSSAAARRSSGNADVSGGFIGDDRADVAGAGGLEAWLQARLSMASAGASSSCSSRSGGAANSMVLGPPPAGLLDGPTSAEQAGSSHQHSYSFGSHGCSPSPTRQLQLQQLSAGAGMGSLAGASSAAGASSLLVQRSLSSMGPLWSAPHVTPVQRSASSASVVAKAVKRSESMHVRMKQLVEAAKVLTQTQHGGEDAIIVR